MTPEPFTVIGTLTQVVGFIFLDRQYALNLQINLRWKKVAG